MNRTKPNTWIHELDGKLVVIKTWHAYPPIPIRSQDWAAYYEDEQEYGNYGWGRTEEDAVQDLVDNYYPGEDCQEREPDYDAPTARQEQIRCYEQKYYGKGL